MDGDRFLEALERRAWLGIAGGEPRARHRDLLRVVRGIGREAVQIAVEVGARPQRRRVGIAREAGMPARIGRESDRPLAVVVALDSVGEHPAQDDAVDPLGGRQAGGVDAVEPRDEALLGRGIAVGGGEAHVGQLAVAAMVADLGREERVGVERPLPVIGNDAGEVGRRGRSGGDREQGRHEHGRGHGGTVHGNPFGRCRDASAAVRGALASPQRGAAMATASIAPRRGQRFDRIVTDRRLAAATVVMLAAVVVAVGRGGHADWGRVPPLIWLHLGLIAVALGLTPVMLLRRKATRSHRILGYVWATAMVATAAVSLAFRTGAGAGNRGVFSGDISPIHVLSVIVLVMVPRLVGSARRHDVVGHRRGVRGIVIGAILIAGFFTFPFDRLLGHWLFTG